MRRSREEESVLDLPGSMWHALARLQRTHPDPVGRFGPLFRPAALVSFAAVTDVVLSARIQVSGAETMHHLHETIRTLIHGFSWDTRYTGPGVALEVTLGKRHGLPIHAEHTIGLTRLSRNAAGTIESVCSTPGGGQCFHCEGTGRALPLREP
jgi:hypothetical protein